MKKHFKNCFIPHEGNDYHPSFWHRSSVHFILLFIIVTFFSGLLLDRAVRQSNLDAQVLPVVLVKLANEDRLKNNASKLIEQPLLIKSATLKAQDMSKKGYFAHTSPEGADPWHWFDLAGYNFYYAGENLAVHFNDSQLLQDAWLASPTHRQNILNNIFTEVGIAVVEGEYQGVPTTFVVQHFGAPAVTVRTQVVQAETKPVVTNTPVQGATAEAAEKEPEPAIEEPKVKVLNEGQNTIVVETTDENKQLAAPAPVPTKEEVKVSLPERFVVNPAYFIKLIYMFVGAIILVTLVLFLFVELRKKHIPIIVTGILLILLMFLSYQIFLQFIGKHFVFVS